MVHMHLLWMLDYAAFNRTSANMFEWEPKMEFDTKIKIVLRNDLEM